MIFVQDCGALSNEVLVCLDYSYDELIKNSTIKITKEAKDWLLADENVKQAFSILPEQSAVVAFNDGKTLLLLKDFKDEWLFWQTLIHEICHIVDHISLDKMFQNESEHRAYLMEYLFKSIRRKITGIDKI